MSPIEIGCKPASSLDRERKGSGRERMMACRLAGVSKSVPGRLMVMVDDSLMGTDRLVVVGAWLVGRMKMLTLAESVRPASVTMEYMKTMGNAGVVSALSAGQKVKLVS